MPLFDDPAFPKPGDKAVQSNEMTLSQAIAAMRAEAEEKRRAHTYGAAAVAVPTKTPPKLSDIQPPPRPASTETAAPAAPVAPVAAIKWAEPSLEVLTQQVYNPYARTDKPKAKTTGGDFGLYAAAAALLFAGALLLSTFFVQKFTEKQIAKAIRKAVAPYAENANVTFSGVSVSLFKQVVSVRNIRITLAHSEETITIDKATAWGVDWPTLKQIAMTRKPVLPKTLKFSLSNIRASVDALGPQTAAALKAMGYKDLKFTTSTDFARTKSSFDLKNFYLEANKMGRLSASLSLGNLAMPTSQELARLKKDPKLILTEPGDFTKATIRSFTFVFEDQTITRRTINWLERQGETSPETLAKMAYAINAASPDAKSVDFVKPALMTLTRFFEKPTSLTLSAHPPREVGVLTLFDEKKGGSINELAHQLNLTLE